jgi:hypothetical protein
MLAAPWAEADFKYQTDLLEFGWFGYDGGSSATFPVTGFQYEVRVNQSSTCSDTETCNGDARDMWSFVWFTPITVNIGSSQGDIAYGLHGGMARGGSGWRNEGITSWYIDWSGYEAAGPALIDPDTGWTHKPHDVSSLTTDRWYKIRVSRVGCEQENGDPGYGWKMEAWHRPETTWDYVGSAGTWCLPLNASTISSAYAFVEIIEPDPCDTDFNYVDMRNFRYKDASGTWKFIDEADAKYGGTADADAQCTDTNWQRLTDNPTWMRDTRDQTRGTSGGLTITDTTGKVDAWDWWPELTDVPRDSSDFLYVGTLEEDGVVNGCAATKFCPENTLTRGQMAKVIIRGLGESTDTYRGYFDDVPSSHIFWPYIEAMKELGITAGCTTSRYCPNANVTRAQLATFLARAMGIDGSSAQADHFSDDDTNVHENNINLLKDRGIVTGCDGTRFCPNSGVKRKDMARWVVRAFDLWQGAP